MSAPTPASPRTTSPGPVFTRPQPRADILKAEAKAPPSRLETTGTELLPGPRPALKPAVRVGAPAPRGEPRPTPVVAKPQRPSIDIVPKDQRNPDPPERTVVMPAAPGRPGVRPRAGFPAPREPETARPPAPSVPSLDALIEPIAPTRQPSNRPAAARSPFVHQRPLDDVQPRTRTDRPAAGRPASVAPPQLHPPSFPPPANEPAGYDHQDSTVAMARPWTPPAPAVQPAQMQMAPQPGVLPGLPGVPMTPQAIPIMPHPGFGPAPPQGFVPPPHLTGPIAPPRPFGIVLFAAPLLLATGLVAALALLF